MKKYVIMLAGGKGERMKASVNKVLLPLCGRSVIIRSISAFIPFTDEMIIVARPEDQTVIRSELKKNRIPLQIRFADSGKTRQASVLSGLRSIISPDDQDIILIHDAARCLVSEDLIRRVLVSVLEYGTGVPGIPACSTYKICDIHSFVLNTPDRSSLFEIQTPQGFTAGRIIPASIIAAEEGLDCTDDAGVLEHFHIPVKIVPGDSSNIKLTEPDDLNKARYYLKGSLSSMRIGMGYDVHRLVPDRKLILCGIEIPFELGLLGHSDADVALHALMDAMLGACALGDIGQYFPDTDERYKNASSMLLLKQTAEILSNHGYQLHNADITITAQKPKIFPYIARRTDNKSAALGLTPDRISVKATTTEKLGFEGRMEGISCYAVCAVVEKE